mgnify:CR=1 FL=1
MYQWFKWQMFWKSRVGRTWVVTVLLSASKPWFVPQLRVFRCYQVYLTGVLHFISPVNTYQF